MLPKVRKRGVAPPGNICEYVHLLSIYTCKVTCPFLVLHSRGGHPHRPAYLPNFEIRSLTLFKCMSIGAHCIPHCKMLVEQERPATLYQPSPHIFFKPVDTTFVWFLAYRRMKAGCCPECARKVLPLVADTCVHIYITARLCAHYLNEIHNG